MKKKLLVLALLTASAAYGRTITYFGNFNGVTFKENFEVFKNAESKTGVKLKGILGEGNTNEAEAFNLMISSGDLADLIGYSKIRDLEKLGLNGGLIPLNELISKHAPNIKKYFEERPEALKASTAVDGNIYMIPHFRAGTTAKAFFIRKDWLDKLGLEEPNTPEELYTVLKAIKEKDPNGNGQQDEIPFFFRRPNEVMESLLSLWHQNPSYNVTEDGKVVFGPQQEGFKEAVKEIKRWYAEGLLDKQMFTRDGNGRDVLLGNDIGGMTHDWIMSTAEYNVLLNKSIPGFNLVAMAPTEYNGIRKEVTAKGIAWGGWGVSAKAKKPEEIVKYMDYWFSEEGRNTYNFGVEGKTFEMVDGKPKFLSSMFNNPDKSAKRQLVDTGSQFERIGTVQNYDYEIQMMTGEAKRATELYQKNYVAKYYYPELLVKFDPKDENEIRKIDDNIRQYTRETFQKWVLGNSDIDKDWNGFQKRLNDLGIEKALQKHNEAFSKN